MALDYSVRMWSEATLGLAREALARGSAVRLRVFGRSMEPALPSGTRIEVRALARAPGPGDVVACARGGRLVVHRVLRVSGSQVVTQGDALAVSDPVWSIAELLGRVGLPQRGTVPPLSLRRRLRRAWRRLLHA